MSVTQSFWSKIWVLLPPCHIFLRSSPSIPFPPHHSPNFLLLQISLSPFLNSFISSFISRISIIPSLMVAMPAFISAIVRLVLLAHFLIALTCCSIFPERRIRQIGPIVTLLCHNNTLPKRKHNLVTERKNLYCFMFSKQSNKGTTVPSHRNVFVNLSREFSQKSPIHCP